MEYGNRYKETGSERWKITEAHKEQLQQSKTIEVDVIDNKRESRR